MDFHLKTAQEVLDEQGVTAEQGLSEAEAERRLASFGENALKEAPKKSFAKRVLEQFTEPMVVILLIAAGVSGALGDVAEMLIIFIVVGINAVLALVQESKAEAALEALQKMTISTSKARRGGVVHALPSPQLVPGDIVLLDAGDSIPADIRLLECASLKIEEASLTGESVPSGKRAEVLTGKVQLGDRANMAYMGTSVVYGRGVGVVVSTGMNTEMGKIAEALTGHEEEKTPLQRKLGHFSKNLSFIILGICAAIFVISFIRFGTEELFSSFMTAVALAVAAIPEGLVVIVTVLLSIGVKKMAEHNAIVRRLTAVETLGCAGVICSDKTGTLTQNKMSVVANFGDTRKLREIMLNCNDAEGDVGDPTEIALKAFGLGADALTRVGEAPFDSMRKLMSTIHKLPDGGFIQYTKGAPDELLKRCVRVDVSNVSDDEVPLTDNVKTVIRNENKGMADKALRVLAGAVKLYDTMPSDLSPGVLEKDLVFIGLCGMIDPVRPEVRGAIEECNAAGITTVMITGDHKDTAVAIAGELGVSSDPAQALSGAQLADMPDSEFDVSDYRVYARVQPEHKVRIVQAWKEQDYVVAMTGDGVNDAPAIKIADIGVGMGITGTDVTKNVADIVLADDNFATIVMAVKEGRRIYENIRKAVLYLMSANIGEVLAVFIASLSGFHILAAIHLLWINLVTDTLPAIALGMEHIESDAMKKPPRDTSEGIFAGGMGLVSCIQGAAIAAVALVAYYIGDAVSHEYAVTMAFVALSSCEALHAFNLRSRLHSVFTDKQQNWILWCAAVLCITLTLCIVYLPVVNEMFDLVPLTGFDLLVTLGLAVTIIPFCEAIKACLRFREKRSLARAKAAKAST